MNLVQTWRAFLKRPEKPFVKLRPAYSVKLVFSYVKGIKIKKTAKFRDTEHLRFEDKENYVTRKVSGLSRNGPLNISRGPFLESPENFSGPKSHP